MLCHLLVALAWSWKSLPLRPVLCTGLELTTKGSVLRAWTTEPWLCSLSQGQAHVAAAVLLLKSCWCLMVATPWGIRIPAAVGPIPSCPGQCCLYPLPAAVGAVPAPLPATVGLERWWWDITKGVLCIPWSCSSPSCCSELPPASPPHPQSSSMPSSSPHRHGFGWTWPSVRPVPQNVPASSPVPFLLQGIPIAVAGVGWGRPASARSTGFWELVPASTDAGDCRGNLKMRTET